MQKNKYSYLLILICSAALLWSPATAQNADAMQLKAKLGIWARNSTVSIINPEDGSSLFGPQKVGTDSLVIRKKVAQPGIYLLAFNNLNGRSTPVYVNVFLTNENIVMNIPIADGSPVVLEGTVAKSFQDLVKNFGGHFDRMSQLNQQLQSAGTYQYSADSINALRKTEVAVIGQKMPYFLKENKTSQVSAFLLNLVWGLQYPLAELEQWVATLEPSALDNNYGKSVKELLETERLTGFGQKAPEFTQNDVHGNPVKLSDFKGKFVLVDFWASWCGPCRMENPAVVSAYQRFQNKNFTIVGVSLDNNRQKWLDAIAKDGLTWTQVSDLGYWNNAVAKLYRVTSIPQNFLLDPQGKIIAKNLRGDQLNQLLGQVLTTN